MKVLSCEVKRNVIVNRANRSGWVITSDRWPALFVQAGQPQWHNSQELLEIRNGVKDSKARIRSFEFRFLEPMMASEIGETDGDWNLSLSGRFQKSGVDWPFVVGPATFVCYTDKNRWGESFNETQSRYTQAMRNMSNALRKDLGETLSEWACSPIRHYEVRSMECLRKQDEFQRQVDKWTGNNQRALDEIAKHVARGLS